MDSPGLDVGDGPLDHLADPVDTLILLLGRLAQFAVGGLLMRRDHPSSHIALVADPPGGVHSLQQSGGVQCGHIVHGPRIGAPGPTRTFRRAGPGSGHHPRALVLDRPQIAAVAPVQAGDEGAVHHDSRSPRAPPRP